MLATTEAETKLKTYKQFIDGAWVDAIDGATYDSEKPVTGMPWARVPNSSVKDVDRAVAAASRAFDKGLGIWPQMLPQERARCLRRLADIIEKRGADVAILESTDNGKLLTEHTQQWVLAVELLHYWAGMADKVDGRLIHAPMPYSTAGMPIPDTFAYTRKEPVGVVAAILPWNSPGIQTLFKLGPSFAVGCTMVAKPSEHTPVSMLELAKLIEEADFPPGVFNVVTSSRREVGAALSSHRDINKVSFTGSTATGKAIIKSAADNLTRVTGELGGKSANIVFADADLEKAVTGTVGGIFAATGQTCMAGSRILVERSFHDEFVEGLRKAAVEIKLGDPQLSETQMGPVSNQPNYEKILSYFDIAEQEGATPVCGGRASSLGGYYVEPTIYTGVNNQMRIAREEVFGPVASIIPFDTEQEAIAIANDTDYGLAGAVFTENAARGHRVAHQLRAGSVWINTYRLMTHLCPFGGYGHSGWGREGGHEGLDAYLESKVVWVPVE